MSLIIYLISEMWPKLLEMGSEREKYSVLEFTIKAKIESMINTC